MTKLTIHVLENGPLKVSNAQSLKYGGDTSSVAGDVYLCRCGDSANPPYCDGTHSKNNFDGSREEPGEQKIRDWEGNDIRTRFNATACMHVFHCKPMKELRAAELAGDTSAVAEIIRVVRSCPSGALTYELKSDNFSSGSEEVPESQVEVMAGGEIRIQCDFEINAPLHDRQPDDRATLCRCGLSTNKPWCDGRHKKKENFR